MRVSAEMLVEVDKELFGELAKIAEVTVREDGRMKFVYRLRWGLEVMGCWLCAGQEKDMKVLGEKSVCSSTSQT